MESSLDGMTVCLTSLCRFVLRYHERDSNAITDSTAARFVSCDCIFSWTDARSNRGNAWLNDGARPCIECRATLVVGDCAQGFGKVGGWWNLSHGKRILDQSRRKDEGYDGTIEACWICCGE